MRVTDFTNGFQHIGIPTTDMTDTLIFYTELGFDVMHSAVNPDSGRRFNFLSLGNLILEVYEVDNAADCYGAIDHFCIDVHDIEGIYDLINSRGLNNLNDEIHFLPFFEKGIRYFMIEGPSREKVEFCQIL